MIIDYSGTHSPITDTAIHSSQLQQFSSSQIGHNFLKCWQLWKFYFEQKAKHNIPVIMVAHSSFLCEWKSLAAFISDLHLPGWLSEFEHTKSNVEMWTRETRIKKLTFCSVWSLSGSLWYFSYASASSTNKLAFDKNSSRPLHWRRK